MAHQYGATAPVVVRLPATIDTMNADDTASRLACACCADGLVIADMPNTTFCDRRGTRALIGANEAAQTLPCELRFVMQRDAILRVWQRLGADKLLAIYASLTAATRV
jgi:anti-anti-sigma regulatory factor